MADENNTIDTQEAAATPEEQVSTKAIAETTNPQDFLDNFDWNKYEEGIEKVDETKLTEFENLVTKNFVDTAHEEVVMGKVVNITDREAIIDINAKSEGVISLNEFRYNPDLKVGDEVEVLI
jgi:small subunit ribosomal protein S1